MDLELVPLDFEGDSSRGAEGGSKRTKEYTGVERRQGQRRLCADRRAMLRFEPGSDGTRRSGNDRRAENSAWNNRYSL